MASKERFPSVPQLLARLILALLVALSLLVPVEAYAKGHGAAVPRKYAGIVIDAKSGKVMYESSADAARYPASVTKVMTLYILFQELKAGNITLDTKFTVSKWSASASPTKLGLRPGSQIRVEDAIKAIVTISANDMARTIAENISGSEAAFARRMTATARALGMLHTTYHNASGLPDAGQLTTVRDQATLGIAIYEHFPEYYKYFQTKSFTYGRRTYGSHNFLLGHDGVDGIKTGYINAAGYNLLTAARIDNRHIVVAGFGFDSGGARDAKVRDLVRTYLPQARQGDYLQAAMIPLPGRKGATVIVASADPAPVMPAPYPSFRLQDGQETAVASLDDVVDPALKKPVAVASIATDDAPIPADRPTDLLGATLQPAALVTPASKKKPTQMQVVGAWIDDTFSQLGAAPTQLGETRASAPLVPPVGIGEQGEAVDPMTSGAVAASVPAEPVVQPEPAPIAVADITPAPGAEVPTGWLVQVGAAPTETGANSLLSDASSKLGGLGEIRPYVERFEKNGQTFFRARFGGFGDRDDAASLCNQLKKAKMSCLAMQS